MRDPYSHVILGLEEHSVPEFVREIALDLGQMWGIARAIFQQLLALPDGTYSIIRDPAKVCHSHSLPFVFPIPLSYSYFPLFSFLLTFMFQRVLFPQSELPC